MSRQEILRAFKFALDPTPAQSEALSRHAGAARWAFNYALGMKITAHEEWRAQVAALVEQGVPEDEARKKVKVPVPTKPAVQKTLNRVKGDSRKGIDGVCPWWHEVNSYAFQSAFIDADQAWKNWLSSLKGERKGRKVGYPRFKSRHRARESFRIHHDVKRPTIRAVGYRRLRVPTIGEIRAHGTLKPMARLVNAGDACVQSVTISRSGHRWYASVLCKVKADLPDKPTRRQAARGTVGVDLGVKHLAALSKPLHEDEPGTVVVDNPKHLAAAERRLKRAQRALSRTQKGSKRREKAKKRVARLHHQVATRRATALHTLSKQLTTGFAAVAIEDLNVSGMTRSAAGTLVEPGKNVKAKAGLNRAVLDAGFGELRRQLEYKARWYGSTVKIADRWFPSSKTCSRCGWVDEDLHLSNRSFQCESCGLVVDRDVNAARNIERHAV